MRFLKFAKRPTNKLLETSSEILTCKAHAATYMVVTMYKHFDLLHAKGINYHAFHVS